MVNIPAPLGRFIRATITRPDYRAWEIAFNEGYKRNGVVQACINLLANTLKEAPCVAVDFEGEPLTQHPFSALMRRPNPAMSQADFWQIVATYVNIGGYCVAKKVYTPMGTVGALWPYHPGMVAPYIGDSGWLEGWTYQNGGRLEIWPVDECIVFRSDYVDPENPFIGLSPIAMAGDAVTLLNEMETTTLAFMQNGGSPGWLIKPIQQPTEEQKAGFADRFKRMFTGNKAGSLMFVDKETEVERLSVQLKELDTSSVAAMYQAEVCGVFRVHPSVAMTYAGLQNSTYSNLETAFREFTSLVRVPIWKSWADQLAQGLREEYPNVNIGFDLSDVASLKSDPDSIVYPTVASWREGIMKRNEARYRLGLEADEQADGYFSELNTPASTVALEAPKENAQRADDWLEERATTYWRSVDNTREEFIRELQPFAAAMVEQAFDQSTRAVRVNPEDISVQRLVQRFFESSGAVRRKYLKRLLDEYVAAAEGSNPEQYIQQVTANTSRVVNEQITIAAGTVKQEIIDVVAKNANKPQQEISKALRDKVDSMTQVNAERIARTTVAAVSSEAAMTTWEEMGGIEKVWLTRRDGSVRPSHASMDGMVVGIREEFTEGVIAPGLAEAAAQGVNCRCVIRPRRVR